MALFKRKKGCGQVVSVETLVMGPHQVELTRKRIKRAYLRLDDPAGPVRVSAPVGMPIAELERFVLGHEAWIEGRKRLLAQSHPASPKRGHISHDGTLLLWGDAVPLAGVSPKASRILASGDAHAGTCEQAEKALLADLRRILALEAEPLVRAYEVRMGVSVAELRIRDMHTRWGTCNATARRVWLALSLVHMPKDCLELIVVHELCHLLESGHGPRFKALMDRHLPDWRTRDAKLKRRALGR